MHQRMSTLCQKQTHAVQQFRPLLGQLVGGQLHFFETVSPSRSPPVVGAMLRVSLVMGPPRISLVIGQCMSLVVGTRIWLVVGPRFAPESGHLQCTSACPLWVISRHVQCKTSCPLYPRKRR